MDSSPPSPAQAATNLQYVHRGAAANLCIHLAPLFVSRCMGPVSRFQELWPRLTWLRVVQEAAVAEVVRRLQQGGVGGAEAQGRGQGGHQRSLPRPHVTLCHAAVTRCH